MTESELLFPLKFIQLRGFDDDSSTWIPHLIKLNSFLSLLEKLFLFFDKIFNFIVILFL